MGDRPLTHQLVERFNDDNVAWCHWKSNRDLAESMDGSTDLDLLVDSARLDDVYEAFASLGFRRGQVAGSRVDVGLEDFLGECQATGNLVHIHTHWRLVSGEAHHKRFRIPFERLILETRQRGDIEGTWTSHPAAESEYPPLLSHVRHRLNSGHLSQANAARWPADYEFPDSGLAARDGVHD